MEEKEVLAQVSPESCEWFRRPKVAMSELVETGKKCGPSQREKEHFQGIGVSASRSGAFGGGARAHKHEECRNAGQEEHEEGVKKPDRDDKNDQLIDAAFQLGGSLFVTATHLTVTRTLIRRCEEYAKDVEAEDGTDEKFKKEASIA